MGKQMLLLCIIENCDTDCFLAKPCNARIACNKKNSTSLLGNSHSHLCYDVVWKLIYLQIGFNLPRAAIFLQQVYFSIQCGFCQWTWIHNRDIIHKMPILLLMQTELSKCAAATWLIAIKRTKSKNCFTNHLPSFYAVPFLKNEAQLKELCCITSAFSRKRFGDEGSKRISEKQQHFLNLTA